MTKKQREQVVELLRCAAECAARGRRSWLDVVAADVGIDDAAVIGEARAACIDVQHREPYHAEWRTFAGDVMPPRWCLGVALEAAQRVEEGWTP